jgi:GT2 family glycosyltransferase
MHNSMETMTYPRTTVIILNWNGLKDTIECLESLRKITYPDYQVLVVDNGSTGDDVKVLRERFGDYIHIIENDMNYGFAEGNNIGMRYALANLDPSYLLLMNNDVKVAPNLLTELVAAAENDTKVGLLGPLVYDYYRADVVTGTGHGQRISWWRGTTYGIRSNMLQDAISGMFEADCIEGSCMLIPRRVLEQVGMLDPEYFAYWEETDWCVRIRAAGYRVGCVTSSKIWHKVKPFYMDSRKLYFLLRNNIMFMRKNADKKYLGAFCIYFTCVSIPLWCFKPFLAHPLGTVGAVAKALFWNVRHKPAIGQ